MTPRFSLSLLLVASLASSTSAWVSPSKKAGTLPLALSLPSSSRSRGHSQMTSLNLAYNDFDDSPEAATPLQLSVKDLELMTEIKSRSLTMPVLIIDAMLPGQKLTLQSADPKFRKLVKYALESEGCNGEIAMIGFHPHTHEPLNMGVTTTINQEDMVFTGKAASQKSLALSLKGRRRFQVMGRPFLDPSQSFYLANVEIVENKKEVMDKSQKEHAQIFYDSIPDMVQEWVNCVLKTEKVTPEAMHEILQDIGPMPKSWQKRAMWVGALVNPTGPPLGVCMEIRPAMLSCHSDHDRLLLSSTALQSSIDSLKEENRPMNF